MWGNDTIRRSPTFFYGPNRIHIQSFGPQLVGVPVSVGVGEASGGPLVVVAVVPTVGAVGTDVGVSVGTGEVAVAVSVGVIVAPTVPVAVTVGVGVVVEPPPASHSVPLGKRMLFCAFGSLHPS